MRECALWREPLEQVYKCHYRLVYWLQKALKWKILLSSQFSFVAVAAKDARSKYIGIDGEAQVSPAIIGFSAMNPPSPAPLLCILIVWVHCCFTSFSSQLECRFRSLVLFNGTCIDAARDKIYKRPVCW